MCSDTPEFETLLDMYSDEHRRTVLATLADEREPLTLDQITDTVVDHVHSSSAGASSDVVTDTRVSLHHHHLPKLAAAGLVEYDPDAEEVAPTDGIEAIEPQLSKLVDIDPRFEPPLEQ